MLPYILVFPLILFLSEIKYKDNYPFRFFSVWILIFFIGLRYNVGVDYPAYEMAFNKYSETTVAGYTYEPGYMLLMKVVKLLTDEFYFLTLLVAIIQILFLYKGLKYFKYYTFALFFFLMMIDGYAFIVNGMRQAIAMCIFFYSLKYIQEQKLVIYIVFLLLASCFHYSAIILFPLYYILRIRINSHWYILSFLVAFLLSQTGVLSALFLKILEQTPYAIYLYSDFLDTTGINSGMVFNGVNILGGLILLIFPSLLKSKPNYLIYMNLFFLFLLSRNLFSSVRIFMRIIPYLAVSILFVYPIALNFLRNTYSRLIFKSLFILFYIISFAACMLASEQPYKIVI